MFAVVHLAYWPAQMSPDSLDQWRQIVDNGGGTDWHPVLSMLLNWIPYKLIPHPAFVLTAQYTLFAFAMGVLLREFSLAGLPLLWTAAVSLVVALFPPNFLIATTLWKDVPYTSGILLLTASVWRMERLQHRLTPGLAGWFTIAGALVIGARHNGLLVVFPLLAILALRVPKEARLWLMILVAGQIASLFLFKVVLLWAFSIAPLPDTYRGIFPLPLIGAMIANGEQVRLSGDELRVVESVMPISEWRKAYRCDTATPLFWNSQADRDAIAKNGPRLTWIALRWALSSPVNFARHQVCMTRILWDPVPREGEWVPISPQEITPMPSAVELGLKTESKLPTLQTWLGALGNNYLGPSAIYNRPATYVLLGLVGVAVLSVIWGQNLLVVYAPALLNIAGLIPSILAQDYRYVWPTQTVGLLFSLAALVALLSRPRTTSGPPRNSTGPH